MNDKWHGDEPELDTDYWAWSDKYDAEHSDDWKYNFTDEEE